MKTLVCSLLFALCAITALAADVTGKWTGTFTPDGGEPQPATIILKQSGTTLTGSGGPDESQQWPIEGGKVDGNRVTGSVKSPDGAVYTIDVTLDGDHLKGSISADMGGQTMKGKMDVARAK
jgi:hypothetical protein